MKYYSEFKDLDQNTIKVEIITTNAGDDTELLIAADGLKITYKGDSLYKPIIKSGCSIDFVIDNVIPDFYTAQLLNPKVYVYKNNTLFWYGYVTPYAYTQPYNLPHETMTVECVDTLAQASNVNYSYIGDKTDRRTFIDVIKHILDKVDPDYNINKIFVANSLSLNNNTNILEQISIVEKNFSDELDNIMKGDEVIEEICRYLGLSMFQYRDAYYIVDYEKLDSTYTSYDRTNGATAVNTLSSTPVDINTLGVVDTNATISIEGLYNKVSIVANTLKMDQPIDNLFDDLTDNSDTSGQYWDAKGYEKINIFVNPDIQAALTNYIKDNGVKVGQEDMWIIQDKVPVGELDDYKDWKKYVILGTWWKPVVGSKWTYRYPVINDASYSGVMSYEKSMGVSNNGQISTSLLWRDGATWSKTLSYEEGKEPLNLKWENYLTIASLNPSGSQSRESLEQHFLEYKAPSLVYKGGAFIINFEYYLSRDNLYPSTAIPEIPYLFDDEEEPSPGPDKIKSFKKMLFPATLSIGNHYWTGDRWGEYSADFLKKIDEGYFAHNLFSRVTSKRPYVYVWESSETGYEINPQFRYIWAIYNETLHDWDYVTEDTYENYTGSAAKIKYEMPYQVETIPGQSVTLHYIDPDKVPTIYWILDENDNQIQVTWGDDKPRAFIDAESQIGNIIDWRGYQNQYVSDKFYLAKTFEPGGKIYGTKYKLNNTCTYELNLNEASEGIAIVVRDDQDRDITLSGQFTFSLGRPVGWDDDVDENDNPIYNPLRPNGAAQNTLILVTHISNLYVKYSQKNDETSVSDTDNDIVYYNVIDSGYIEEYSDIEMKVNTYTNKTTSYSYVLHNDEYIENITYNNKTQKQEYNILEKIIRHYESLKYVYTNVLHNKNDNPITLCSLLTDSSLNKTMPVTSIEYDMTKNYANVTCIEI